MTVHLACYSRKETPPRRPQARHRGTAIPDVAAGMELPVLCHDPEPGLPTSGTEGPSYGWRTTRREGAGMLTEANACHRTAESRAGRRSSGQLTVRDADLTHVRPFTTGCYTRYCVWTWEKVLNIPHTELTSEQCHYSWLRQLFWVASVMCYWVHSHLGTLVKCCCM